MKMNKRTLTAILFHVNVCTDLSSSLVHPLTQSRRTASSTASHLSGVLPPITGTHKSFMTTIDSRRMMMMSNSSSSSNSSSLSATSAIKQIGKLELEMILKEIEEVGREQSGYIVIDVRNEDEIQSTGKLRECVNTLPLPLIGSAALSSTGALGMEDEEFEEEFGFAKPAPDEKIAKSKSLGAPT